MRHLVSVVAAVAALSFSTAAISKPVTDCPMRDAPFSADSPLIDVLLSPAAKAVIDKEVPGRFDKLPPNFAGTKAPTFAAIMTLRAASGFVGMKPDTIENIDKELRKLPVTEADKAARCERYDNDVPQFNLQKGKRHILLFEKINGFVHVDAVPAARAAFSSMGDRRGWSIATTDKGGAINSKTLRQFDVVIWNNNSGDVLSLSQRAALKAFIEKGGGFVAIHGAGGDPAYFWDWYADAALGARFKGHPMAPQFQDGRVVVADKAHPIVKALPAEWTMSEEWYSFNNNPRKSGAHVLLTLDEASYKPDGMMGQDLRMGDHPIAWTNCIGKGRAFYSAIGHKTESYAQPQYLALLEAAVDWAADKKQQCAIAKK
jgi:type 1 glutamine amidotransferase